MRHTRPQRRLLISAAHACGTRVAGVVPSGRGGADGLRIVEEHCGLTLAQSLKVPNARAR